MIKGLNHITIAVSDIARSVDFYKRILGFEVHVVWEQGAYLTAGDLWYCLSVDPPGEKTDYTHIAFTVDRCHFKSFYGTLLSEGVGDFQASCPKKLYGFSLSVRAVVSRVFRVKPNFFNPLPVARVSAPS